MSESKQKIKWLFWTILFLALLWILFSRLIVPNIIEAAYNGESFSFFNNLLSGRTNHPLQDYLIQWEKVSTGIVILFLLLLLPVPFILRWAYSSKTNEQQFTGIANHDKIPLYVNSLLALVGFCGLYYLYYFDPVNYVYFITEDYWAEYGSFASFTVASFLLIWVIYCFPEIRKAGFVLLALGSFFIAMEEISWGQRIFRFSTPTFFAEQNYQQETNLHNLVSLPKHYVIGIILFMWSIVLPILNKKINWIRKLTQKLGIPIVPIWLYPFFLLACFFLIFTPFVKSDEAAELFWGISFALFSVDFVNYKFKKQKPGTIIRFVLVVILYIGLLTANMVYFFTIPNSVKERLNYFAIRQLPEEGMNKQAIMVYEYLNNHPHLRNMDTPIYYGRLLKEMGNREKANTILEETLNKFENLKNLNNPNILRNEAIILKSLDRLDQANETFHLAIYYDHVRLDSAQNDRKRSRIRMSLGKTYMEMGEIEKALEEFQKARKYLNPEIQSQLDNLERLAGKN